MKKILSLLLLASIITSCWTSADTWEKETRERSINIEKWERPSWVDWKKSWTWSFSKDTWNKTSSNDFLIETNTLSDFTDSTYIEKIGQVVSEQTLDLKSQVSGRLSEIYIKEWQEIYKWEVLAKISDSYSKYYLDLEKAQIDYEKQVINKESQLISIEKQITNAEISLNEAKQNYENAKISATEDTKKTELDYQNSNLVDKASQASLELEKAKLDYENILNSNKQTLNTHINNVKKEYNSLVLSLTDIIKFSDELLWVSNLNKDKNDNFKDYLWAKDTSTLYNSKTSLSELMIYNNEIKLLNLSTINEENLVKSMNSFYDWYQKISILLEHVEWVLNNSISSIGSLSDSDIESYISKINSYQNSNNWNLSNFTSTKSSINTFLNTYKNSELSSLKNIELQELKLEDSDQSWEISYNKSLISIQNTLNSFETKYKQAELTYNNYLKEKEVTTKSLDNSIASAKNSLNKAEAEYAKLTIISPISWIVSSINTDNNTDISNGTNLFTIVSNDNTQIEVSLNASEIEKISVWDKAELTYLWNDILWKVYSKSIVADSNLEYKLLITLDKKINLIGWSTTVKIYSNSEKVLLPLEIIEITWDNLWFINILKDWNSSKLDVELWKINWKNVEVLSWLTEEIDVIITDLWNYNSLTQSLKVNNK